LATLSPAVRARAAQVLASNVDAAALPLISRYATDNDPRIREQAMLAAGRLGPSALNLALYGLNDSSPLVRQAAAWAACHGGDRAFEPLSKRLKAERNPSVLVTLLANLWRLEDSPWPAAVAAFAGSSDVDLRRAAAYSLSRTGEAAARDAQRRLAADAEPVIRATVLGGFATGALEQPDLHVVLAALEDTDWRVRAAACQVLTSRDEIAIPAASGQKVVADFSSKHPHLAVSALAAAGAQASVGTTVELLAVVNGGEPSLASEALAALAQRDPAAARKVARRWIGSPELWRHRAAARVAVASGPEIERSVAADRDAGVRLAWIGALDGEQTIERRELLLGLLESDPDPAVRAQALSLLREAGAAPDVENLVELFASWKGDEMGDARGEAIISALAAAGTESERDGLLALGLEDADSAVAAMVVNGARNLGLEVALPGREPRHGTRWYENLDTWTVEPRFLDVITDRGSFRIRLDVDSAPITSREIWDLAVDGFYDGLDFHRVVPNFVIQGGDPRGDGWGGPGFALPDEPSLIPFDSWRVGIATSGPNTGGCQLFVTLLPADRLTGHYTNFGEVVSGREVLTELRVGDRIREIRAVTENVKR
jgi:cyclophilin family peptidyl-prolyl cis-trans isomerase/HEAT repeat protein